MFPSSYLCLMCVSSRRDDDDVEQADHRVGRHHHAAGGDGAEGCDVQQHRH